jgi:DnaJ-class molecular chaperone
MEPHTRFVCAGDDLATVMHIPLADALAASPVTILDIAGRSLTLQPPKGSIISPGSVLKCPGEGMPMPEEPSKRGDLYVKFEVFWPVGVDVSPAEAESLRAILSRGKTEMPPNVHDKAEERASAGTETLALEPGLEVEFGSSEPEPAPMLCAQQ